MTSWPPDDDWIICLGQTRQVRDGRVPCPQHADRATTLIECEVCRHFQWRLDERLEPAGCSTERDS